MKSFKPGYYYNEAMDHFYVVYPGGHYDIIVSAGTYNHTTEIPHRFGCVNLHVEAVYLGPS